MQQFERDGYLVVENLIDRETILAPLVAEYEAVLAALRDQYVAEGKLGPAPAGQDFQARVSEIYGAGLEYFQPLDISLPAGEILPDTPFHAGPAVFDLMTAPALLDAVERFIGPEITSNPIQHVRIKPPSNELMEGEVRAHITSTQWHQDRAVTLEEADGTRMITAWLAVTDATVDNGCLQVVPGSHRGEMLPHCPQGQLGIPGEFVARAEAKPLPVKAGGVIFFHPLTVHGSLANTSDVVRWSFDLRYNVTGDPTGRAIFPSFVARSRAAPDTELRDAAAWRALWEEARSNLAVKGVPAKIHRWSADAAVCA